MRSQTLKWTVGTAVALLSAGLIAFTSSIAWAADGQDKQPDRISRVVTATYTCGNNYVGIGTLDAAREKAKEECTAEVGGKAKERTQRLVDDMARAGAKNIAATYSCGPFDITVSWISIGGVRAARATGSAPCTITILFDEVQD